MGFWFWLGWRNVDWAIFLRKNIEKTNFENKSITFVVFKSFSYVYKKWKNLMKTTNWSLKYVPNLVATCLCLHNLCIIENDSFWHVIKWANTWSWDSCKINTYQIDEEAIQTIKWFQNLILMVQEFDVSYKSNDEYNKGWISKKSKDKTNKELFKTSKISHFQIARVLYNANLQKNNNLKILNDESKFWLLISW